MLLTYLFCRVVVFSLVLFVFVLYLDPDLWRLITSLWYLDSNIKQETYTSFFDKEPFNSILKFTWTKTI